MNSRIAYKILKNSERYSIPQIRKAVKILIRKYPRIYKECIMQELIYGYYKIEDKWIRCQQYTDINGILSYPVAKVLGRAFCSPKAIFRVTDSTYSPTIFQGTYVECCKYTTEHTCLEIISV